MRAHEKRGLFPFPGEKPEQFAARIGVWGESRTIDPELQAALTLFASRVDLYPDWVACEENRRGLALWHAAATWSAGAEMPPKIALHPFWRSLLRHAKRFWQEVLCHELVHAVRVPLAGTGRYEESIAYLLSSSPLRRLLGPLFGGGGITAQYRFAKASRKVRSAVGEQQFLPTLIRLTEEEIELLGSSRLSWQDLPKRGS